MKSQEVMESDELVKVFTGSEVSAIMLRGILEEMGIGSIIRNEYRTGLDFGFVGGVATSVDLFINHSDFSEAEPVIRDFTAKDRT